MTEESAPNADYAFAIRMSNAVDKVAGWIKAEFLDRQVPSDVRDALSHLYFAAGMAAATSMDRAGAHGSAKLTARASERAWQIDQLRSWIALLEMRSKSELELVLYEMRRFVPDAEKP